MPSLLDRRPLLIFTAATFGISYLVGVPFLFVSTPLASQLHPLAETYLPRLYVVFGPALAAIFVVARTGGAQRVRQLLAMLRPERRHVGWWLGLPVVGVLVAGGAFYLAGVPLTSLVRLMGAEGDLLLAHFALQLGLVGVGEELGWRGWLLPHLLKRRTWLGATALIAVVWGAWHGPMLLSSPQVALPFVGLVVALSVLFTFVWSRVDGNVFVLALAHASVNAPVFFLEQMSYAGALDAVLVLKAWPWVAACYGGLAVFVLLARWRWWRSAPVLPAGSEAIATYS